MYFIVTYDVGEERLNKVSTLITVRLFDHRWWFFQAYYLLHSK